MAISAKIIFSVEDWKDSYELCVECISAFNASKQLAQRQSEYVEAICVFSSGDNSMV